MTPVRSPTRRTVDRCIGAMWLFLKSALLACSWWVLLPVILGDRPAGLDNGPGGCVALEVLNSVSECFMALDVVSLL